MIVPLVGRRRDQYVHDTSDLNSRLRAAQIGHPIQYKEYILIVDIDPKVLGSLRIKGIFAESNRVMPTQRIGAEWSSDKICQITAYVDQCKVQNVRWVISTGLQQ
jgi:hypothetical protein